MIKPSYCKDCQRIDLTKPRKTGFGTFDATCQKYKIGVNRFTYTCDAVEPQQEFLDTNES